MVTQDQAIGDRLMQEAKETLDAYDPNVDASEVTVEQVEAVAGMPGIQGVRHHGVYTTLWRCDDGGKVEVLTQMLPALAPLRDSQGRPVFSDRPVDHPYLPIGDFICILHRDHPNRNIFSALGMPTCTVNNLASEHQAELHLELHHPAEHNVIEKYRKRIREQEEREQRELDRKANLELREMIGSLLMRDQRLASLEARLNLLDDHECVFNADGKCGTCGIAED